MTPEEFQTVVTEKALAMLDRAEEYPGGYEAFTSGIEASYTFYENAVHLVAHTHKLAHGYQLSLGEIVNGLVSYLRCDMAQEGVPEAEIPSQEELVMTVLTTIEIHRILFPEAYIDLLEDDTND